MGFLSADRLGIGARRRTRKLLRTVQSSLPWLREPKYLAQAKMRALLGRPHEPEFEIFGRLTVASTHSIIDIGANRGQSIDSIRLYLPDAEIHAFEPQQTLAERLQRAYGARPGITVHGIGLGSRPGELQLFVPVYRGYVYDGLASTVRTEAADWLSPKTIYGFDRSKLELLDERIPIDTLDSLDLTPACLKLDVQGAEHDVLLGGRKMIEAHRPLVLLESPSQALLDDFASWGYEPRWWDGERLVPDNNGSRNTFLVPLDCDGTGWKLQPGVLA